MRCRLLKFHFKLVEPHLHGLCFEQMAEIGPLVLLVLQHTKTYTIVCFQISAKSLMKKYILVGLSGFYILLAM